MKLSILIPSTTDRADLLHNLLWALERQKTDQVEIITEIDNYEMTVGSKRNLLVSRATGDYICFIDDDDHIAHNYISSILSAIEKSPDCIGFVIKQFNFINGKPYKLCQEVTYSASLKMKYGVKLEL